LPTAVSPTSSSFSRLSYSLLWLSICEGQSACVAL
jgi:hypothetical protein